MMQKRLTILFIFRYFLGTLPQRPDVRHVFRVQDASTHNDTTPVSSECLSCNLNHVVNVSICQYARASMSKDFSHYVLDCMGPTGKQCLLVFTVCGVLQWCAIEFLHLLHEL